MSDGAPILIAGAGIAGLSAALALAAKGFAVTVFDQRVTLSEAGAGIQIGPNGVKALARLGVREAVDRAAFRPEALTLRTATTGAPLARLPLGETAVRRYGAPYLTLMRADLQAALLTAAAATPGITLALGLQVTDIAITADGVTVRSADGRSRAGTALIGADGLRSRVRTEVADAIPHATGYVAFRAVIPLSGERLPDPFALPEVGLWLGRSAHVVHYPVGDGGRLNIVVVIRSGDRTLDWDEPGRPGDLSPYLIRWPPALRALLLRAPEWRRWTLHDMAAPQPWSRGPIVLIGDAAHPVLPFLGQGAVMALEDAVALGEVVAAAGRPGQKAFARFERLRAPRAVRLAEASRRNALTYHYGGAAAFARDIVLRWMPPAALFGRFDWLYGFDPASYAAAAALP